MRVDEGTPDDRYFEWLYSQVASIKNRNPARCYWRLIKRLYETPFTAKVAHDKNRAVDGVELRYEFFGEEDLGPGDHQWRELECSILEMLIALARRSGFQSDDEPGTWFWTFMENLELKKYTDAVYSSAIDEEVGATLRTLVQRKYAEDGTGGLFPLRYPERDQRKVEIWYQLAAYLMEGG